MATWSISCWINFSCGKISFLNCLSSPRRKCNQLDYLKEDSTAALKIDNLPKEGTKQILKSPPSSEFISINVELIPYCVDLQRIQISPLYDKLINCDCIFYLLDASHFDLLDQSIQKLNATLYSIASLFTRQTKSSTSSSSNLLQSLRKIKVFLHKSDKISPNENLDQLQLKVMSSIDRQFLDNFDISLSFTTNCDDSICVELGALIQSGEFLRQQTHLKGLLEMFLRKYHLLGIYLIDAVKRIVISQSKNTSQAIPDSNVGFEIVNENTVFQVIDLYYDLKCLSSLNNFNNVQHSDMNSESSHSIYPSDSNKSHYENNSSSMEIHLAGSDYSFLCASSIKSLCLVCAGNSQNCKDIETNLDSFRLYLERMIQGIQLNFTSLTVI